MLDMGKFIHRMGKMIVFNVLEISLLAKLSKTKNDEQSYTYI